MPEKNVPSATPLSRATAALLNFWRELKFSAYDLGWYRHQRRTHLGGGLRYFFAFHAVLAALYVLAAAPGLVGLPRAVREFVENKVPVASYVEVKGGQFMTNLPDGWKAGDNRFAFVSSPTLEGLNAPTRAERNWVVVGRDAAFVSQEARGLTTRPLGDVPDFRLTREAALAWVITQMPAWLVALAFVFLLGFWAVSMAAHAALVVLFSWLAQSASRLARAPIAFGAWLGMGWRLVTAPSLAVLLLHLFGVDLPFAWSAVYLMFVAAIIMDEKNDPVANNANQTTGDRP
jgi:hypothetical protein